MCSRYSLTAAPKTVRRLFQAEVGDFPPRYNIAPTDPVLIVRLDHKGTRELHLVRWGFIPAWAKDPAALSLLINARTETAAEKPAFRGALRHRRCLIPATGFYEWTGAKGAKQPHLIAPTGREVFAFGGLWETWLGADGSEIDTVAILTVSANAAMRPLHDRMPLIISEQDYDRWLDCRPGSAAGLDDLLGSSDAIELTITRVGREVNNPRAEGPDLHEPSDPSLI